MSFDEKMRVARFVLTWFVLLAVVATILVVVFRSDVRIDLSNIALSDMLTIILAIFAISLSVAFYLKSVDTSNKFYDNNYRFTKDISETLGRIEERFGERLEFIGKGQTQLHNDFQSISGTSQMTATITKNVDDVEQEKRALVDDLAQKAGLEQDEKDNFVKQLGAKDRALERLRAQRNLLAHGHISLSDDIVQLDQIISTFSNHLVDDLQDFLIANESNMQKRFWDSRFSDEVISVLRKHKNNLFLFSNGLVDPDHGTITDKCLALLDYFWLFKMH